MKNIAKVIILLITVTSLCLPIIASSYIDKDMYINDDIEILINNECSDAAANKLISAFHKTSFSKATPMVTQSSIFCIFGHSLESGTLTRIFHNVNSSQPKCLKELWWYDVCTRSTCDYSNYELVSSAHTYNCH